MRRIHPMLAAFAVALLSGPAHAHLDPGEHGSFAAGFTHPFFGVDHVLAMVTVGVWAALIGGRAMWQVPAAFVGTMGIGFVLALGGVPLPFVEPTVLASIVVIGLLAASAMRLPAGIAAAIVAFFALFHGYAHGGEIGSAGIVSYATGFALATTVLHATSIALTVMLARFLGVDKGAIAGRILGGAAAAGGLMLALV